MPTYPFKILGILPRQQVANILLLMHPAWLDFITYHKIQLLPSHLFRPSVCDVYFRCSKSGASELTVVYVGCFTVFLFIVLLERREIIQVFTYTLTKSYCAVALLNGCRYCFLQLFFQFPRLVPQLFGKVHPVVFSLLECLQGVRIGLIVYFILIPVYFSNIRTKNLIS